MENSSAGFSGYCDDKIQKRNMGRQERDHRRGYGPVGKEFSVMISPLYWFCLALFGALCGVTGGMP
jgi:hypothetical protein